MWVKGKREEKRGAKIDKETEVIVIYRYILTNIVREKQFDLNNKKHFYCP